MPNPNRDLYDDLPEDNRDPGAGPEERGVPEYADDLDEENVPSNPEHETMPGEEPVAVNAFGTTDLEAMQGEGLERKLAREEPDFGDESTSATDSRPAEEAAMRVEEL